MIESHQFFIKTQTPLHIGCDEVYEPMSFVIDENNKVLISFDPLDFFSRLSKEDKEKFSNICREGTIHSIQKLYQFMRGKETEGHPVALCSGFIEHYRENLAMKGSDKKLKDEINQFKIMRTAFLENTNEPYIPGSAIKGALRTACLNALAKTAGHVDYNPKDKGAAAHLEKKLLKFSDPGNDPFRMVKVSDFLPVFFNKRIVYAVNEKKKESKFAARGPYPILEIIEPGAVFIGTIKVENPPSKDSGIQKPLTLPAVLESAASFYTKEKQREEGELSQAGLPEAKFKEGDALYPLRIGRHSGAESVTIEGYRDIKIMGGKGRTTFSNKGAGTFWLAAERKKDWNKKQLQPFGWVCLGKVDEKLAAEFDQLREKQKEKADTVRSNPLTKGEPSGSLESVSFIPPPPVEDVWENAQVFYDAGGAGKISAQMQGKSGASLVGKGNRDNLKAAVSEVLHKNLFEKKKPINARVTVRKVGNAWEIVRVDPQA